MRIDEKALKKLLEENSRAADANAILQRNRDIVLGVNPYSTSTGIDAALQASANQFKTVPDKSVMPVTTLRQSEERIMPDPKPNSSNEFTLSEFFEGIGNAYKAAPKTPSHPGLGLSVLPSGEVKESTPTSNLYLEAFKNMPKVPSHPGLGLSVLGSGKEKEPEAQTDETLTDEQAASRAALFDPYSATAGLDAAIRNTTQKPEAEKETGKEEAAPEETTPEEENNTIPTTTGGSVVYDAEKRISEMLDKLRSGRTSYSDRLDEMLNNLMNRESFRYDPNADMLYQNYLAGMQNAGQMAMRDTMGQAAMLTGGYGSSYATAAANGAYNNYLQKANEALPDFYNMAANAYDREGDNLISQINLLRNQDNEEYNRYVDALQAEVNRDNELYNRTQADYENQIQALKSDYENQIKALEAATAGINNMTPAQENSVMSGALSAAEGQGGMEAVERYLSGLTGYNLSPDFADRVRQYVEQHTTTIRVVKDKRKNSKDVFTDGTYDENGKLKTWTAEELFKQEAITKKQYEDLEKADLKEGMTYTLLF